MAPEDDRTVTWRDFLVQATDRLDAAGVRAPDVDARRLIEEATGYSGAELAKVLSKAATVRSLHYFQDMLARREAGEPLQYVLGRWGFRTLDLLVDKRALIPRPETEVLVGVALDELARQADGEQLHAVDLGVGSGAVALSIAAERHDVDVIGVERSPEALAVARSNLAGLGRPGARVRLLEGSWFEPLPDELRGEVHVVVSNPPYVAETDELPSEVADWEPTDALIAGPTGLEAAAEIIGEAIEWLRPGGALVLELSPRQLPTAAELAQRAGFGDVSVLPDLTGRHRVLRCRAQRSVEVWAQSEAFDRALEELRAGRPIVVPTDTVYGLAVPATETAAVSELHYLKARPTGAPIAILVADLEQAQEAAVLEETALRLADAFWPGPLTIVALARMELGGIAKDGTIGIRCPDAAFVRRLAAEVGPIAATSANRHREPTPASAEEAVAALIGGVSFAVDGGPLEGDPSTVVRVHPTVEILRDGPIAASRIEAVLAAEPGAVSDAQVAVSEPEEPAAPEERAAPAPEAEVAPIDDEAGPDLDAEGFEPDDADEDDVAYEVEAVGAIEDSDLPDDPAPEVEAVGEIEDSDLPDDEDEPAAEVEDGAEVEDVAVEDGAEVEDVAVVEEEEDESEPGVYRGPPAEVLFICTGNICRSTMAEAMLNQRAAERGFNVSAISAGLQLEGATPPSGTVKAMARRDLDVSDHRSQLITADLVGGASIVVGMTNTHARAAFQLAPRAQGRIVTLKELVRLAEETDPREPSETVDEWFGRVVSSRSPKPHLGDSKTNDIADPYGRSNRVHRKTADQIEDLIDRLVAVAFDPGPGADAR